MAGGKQVPSFDEIIQAGRQRSKNEALANEIFRKGRKSTTPASNNGLRTATQPPSLASRITPTGVGKRSSSNTSFKQTKVPSRPTSAAAQKTRVIRIGASIASADTQAKIQPSPKSTGIKIRGISGGPFHVQASNFAPGTTAADIESALSSVVSIANQDTLTSCRILTPSPTVIAEMVFTDRTIADEVINAFNGQKADGRILNVYLKLPPGGVRHETHVAPVPKPVSNDPPAALWTEDPTPAPPIPQAPKELVNVPANDTAMDDVVEITSSQTDLYDNEGQGAERERETRRAEPDFQDGRYGFTEAEQSIQPPKEDPRPSYHEGSREDRDRNYDRSDRGDRERGDRRYNDRYSRGDSYRRDDRYRGEYDRGPPRNPPPYNNNMNGRGGRGEWRGGGDRPGRMYSDNMIPRGGRYRGGGGFR